MAGKNYYKTRRNACAVIDVFEEFNLRCIDYTPLVEYALHRFEKHSMARNYSEIKKKLRDCAKIKCLFKYTKKSDLE